jgi:hypothetical protein
MKQKESDVRGWTLERVERTSCRCRRTRVCRVAAAGEGDSPSRSMTSLSAGKSMATSALRGLPSNYARTGITRVIV